LTEKCFQNDVLRKNILKNDQNNLTIVAIKMLEKTQNMMLMMRKLMPQNRIYME